MICAVNTIGDAFELVISQMKGEKVLKEGRYALAEMGFVKDSFFGKAHHIKIDLCCRTRNIKICCCLPENMSTELTVSNNNQRNDTIVKNRNKAGISIFRTIKS